MHLSTPVKPLVTPVTSEHALHCCHSETTMPCSQYKTQCVNQHCISLYVLYSATNVFKTIIGCGCHPLLVLRLPNDFLFNSEPKVARWDLLHQYWTTNSVLGVDVNMGEWGVGVGWMSTWVGCGRVDVNMGGCVGVGVNMEGGGGWVGWG